ncbi:homogentisate 1,2-dioxygenase [Iamia majanohamensis]|uniref:Homogentisate 1,2-dioxygenase n=1 Tax=Iamia majanohamensis TaxID=467976 RepID=A0AAE9Y3Z1_9ACTN|nr:homogentisate 1,2-dioxygenase [Iamia majanohamensis]WCO65704.1 homogentisate 1,2-dioxygenase [Iamia majanohamensis]
MDGVPQWSSGLAARQAHVAPPPGTVEEEHGREGFSGPASHLYRLHAPTGWTSVEGPAVHRAYDSGPLADGPDALWPTPLLANAQVAIGVQSVRRGRPELLRDVDGDRCLFVHRGEGTLRTEYGPLRYRPGDYLVVPRGTTHRVEPATPTTLLVVTALGSRFRLPDRGLLGRHALFDPAVVEVPEAEAVEEDGDFTVVVRRGGADTLVHYPFHPCDVVGWKGDLAPLRLPVEAIRPVVSPRYHLPPSVHTTWVTDGAVVSTFVPRPVETDPEAVRLPFFHRNVDFDEVIFYHRGQFSSRAGIGEGSLTFHPSGLHHGPQPAARQRDADAAAATTGDGHVPRTHDEVAVMVDARQPLHPAPEAAALEVEGYVRSWADPAVAAGER